MAIFGYETYDSYPTYDPYEEERRRREEEMRREEERLQLERDQPTTQTIKLNPDGTQDITIKGSAANLAQMSQPRAMPIPTAPMAPDQTYNRMLQIESGNRDYTPSGAPVVSPAGAMYASQVMPGTAAQPGFGVRPVQAQTPEEYNRVGREYFDAMRKRYGGNDELAAAAYHSGPGNVDRALQQAQATGQDWRSFLGPQGQAYVAKAVPGQATPVAAPAVNAQPTAVAPQDLGEFAGVDRAIAQQAAQPQPTYTPQQTEAALASMERERHMNDFITAQNDNLSIEQYIANPHVPEDLRDQMRKSYREKLANEYRLSKGLEDVKKTVESGDTTKLARMVSAKGDEGSIAKAFLYSLIGFKSGAHAEVAKMNLPDKWAPAELENGKTGMVQYSTSGMPLRGVKSDGTPMDEKELMAYASGGLAKGVHVTKTENYIDPATGQIVTHSILSNNKEKFTMGGKPLPEDFDRSKLVPEKQFTAAEDRRVTTAIENLRKNVPVPTEQDTLKALTAARVPVRRIEQEMGYAPGTLGTGTGRIAAATTASPYVGTGVDKHNIRTGSDYDTSSNKPKEQVPATPMSPSALATPAATPTTTPKAATVTTATPDQPPEKPVIRDIMPGERKDKYDAYVKGEEDKYKKQLATFENKVKIEQKEAEAFREVAVTTRGQLAQIKEAVDVVRGGQYLMGPLLGTSGSKVLPGVQEFFASKFGDQTTTDNTRMLRSLMTREGLQGIKNSMGPSISNFDVQAWLKSNPVTEQSSPQALEKYFTKLHNTLYDLSEQKRQNAVKQGMLEPSFSLGDKIPEADGGEVDYNNPLLKKKKQ